MANFLDSFRRVTGYAAPLAGLIPGVGPLGAAGIGAGVGFLSGRTRRERLRMGAIGGAGGAAINIAAPTLGRLLGITGGGAPATPAAPSGYIRGGPFPGGTIATPPIMGQAAPSFTELLGSLGGIFASAPGTIGTPGIVSGTGAGPGPSYGPAEEAFPGEVYPTGEYPSGAAPRTTPWILRPLLIGGAAILLFTFIRRRRR